MTPMTGVVRAVPTVERLGGWAGVLGIALPLGGLLILPIWQFPGTNAGAGEVSAFVAEHRPALKAMMFLYTLGVGLWLVFGAAVWARLRESLPATSVLPACFAAGVIGFVTLLLAGFAVFDVLTYRNVDPRIGLVLYDLTFGLLAMSGVPTAVALSAYAAAVGYVPALPPHTGHLAAVTAATHLLLLTSFIATSGFFALEGLIIAAVPALLWIWIADTGAALLRAAHPRS
jgi:hypothetical protein